MFLDENKGGNDRREVIIVKNEFRRRKGNVM